MKLPSSLANNHRLRAAICRSTAAAIFLAVSSTQTVFAIGSDEMLDLGAPTADSLQLEGDQALRMGDMKTALKDLQKAVALDPKNVQARSRYAEALEQRLRKQATPDPKLYNFVIKQWVHAYKDAQYDESEERTKAHNHLESLCGSTPKFYETSKRFLDKTLLPEDGTAKVSFADAKSND